MSILLLIIAFIIFFSFLGVSNYLDLNANQSIRKFKEMEAFKNNIMGVFSKQILSGESDSLILRNIKAIINRGGASSSMIAPIDGFITQGIDTLISHNGVDIISYKGDKIKSALDGIILFSGENGDLGKSLIISHPYNYFTVYGHCDSILCNQREIVKKGQIIATVGETGVATAPHLHFEVWHNNQIIDPREIIQKYGDLDVSTE
tara:strand:- start:73 stop:687 length:615 start_codon:yes stop_codon:yes gene_type:complete